MKKLFVLALLAVAMTASAEDKNENLVVADDVITEEGGIQLSKNKKENENDRWVMHFALGVNIPDKADGNSFAPFRSWEFNWTILQYDCPLGKSNTTLSAGVGVNWRNYTLSGHKNGFVKVGDYVSVFDVDANYTSLASVMGDGSKLDDFSSNIQTLSLNIPLLIKQRFSKSFAISLGAQLNWNYYARIHNYYTVDDRDYDEYVRKVGQRPITVDVLGILHFGRIGVYCKYSPMSVLKKDRGVEFKSFAAGIYF